MPLLHIEAHVLNTVWIRIRTHSLTSALSPEKTPAGSDEIAVYERSLRKANGVCIRKMNDEMGVVLR